MNSISELKIDNKYVDITLKLDIFNQLLLKSNIRQLVQPIEAPLQLNNKENVIINNAITEILNSVNQLKQEMLLLKSQSDVSINKCIADINILSKKLDDNQKENNILMNNQNTSINISNLQKSLQDTNNRVNSIDLNITAIEYNINALTSSLKSLSINLQDLLQTIDKLTINLKDSQEVLESLKTSKEMSIQAMKLAWEVSNKISKI